MPVMPKGAEGPFFNRENVMSSKDLLGQLAGLLASGGVEVVDCTGVLGPDTPLLKLPPDFAKDTPKIEIHRISAYDQDLSLIHI